MKARVESEPINLGFQIAPMIDIVFVIMLFFMVMAGAMKAERHFTVPLPGISTVDGPQDEVVIAIEEDGTVTLDDEVFGAPNDARLQTLAGDLARLQTGSIQWGGRGILATVKADPTVQYQRIIDVMDALTRAKVTHVTFTVGDEQN